MQWRGREEESSGREAELSLLLRELDEAKTTERARFVFVKGSTGVGKSHLFGLLRGAVAKRNTHVFEGGSGRDSKRVFGLFTPIVNELLAHLGPSGVPAARLAELARLLGPLTKATGTAVMENRRVELYDAVSELFSLAGRGQPVFLLPDLDVADRASLELFRYVAAVATTPGSHFGGLFVASLREDETLPVPLGEIIAKVPARSLPLNGLDVEGIRSYLARQDVAQRLREATGGNPEALNALLEQKSASPVDFFLRRAERLEAPQRAVLDALAVSRDALNLSVLRTRGEVAVHLDVLVRERFLSARVVDGQPVYRFSREADRQAWLYAAEAGSGAHGALARCGSGALVAGRRRPWKAAAPLLLELGRNVESVELAVKAADELSARGAHEEAADLYAQALQGLKGPGARSGQLDRSGEKRRWRPRRANYKGAARVLLESHRLSPQAAKVLLVGRHLVRLGRLRLAELSLGVPAARSAATRDDAEAIRAEVALARSPGGPAKAIEICRRALSGAPANSPRKRRSGCATSWAARCWHRAMRVMRPSCLPRTLPLPKRRA